MTNRIRIPLGIAALLITLAAGGYYQYNKPALQVSEAAAEPVSADALLTAFHDNEPEANKQYLNKVLQVTGNVADIQEAGDHNLQVLLDANDPMSTIACTIEEGKRKPAAGQKVTVKGICTGYLNDVILIKCILVNTEK